MCDDTSPTLYKYNRHKKTTKIKVIMLYNWFSQFFSSHSAITLALPIINSENGFSQLRGLLLNRPTIPEYEMASRIAKAIKRTPNEEADDPLVRVRLKNSQNLITISSFIAPMKNDSRATIFFISILFLNTCG
jgi:hypothetical protein